MYPLKYVFCKKKKKAVEVEGRWNIDVCVCVCVCVCVFGISLVDQMVKNPTVMQETWAGSLDWEKCIYICVCVCVCVCL